MQVEYKGRIKQIGQIEKSEQFVVALKYCNNVGNKN